MESNEAIANRIVDVVGFILISLSKRLIINLGQTAIDPQQFKLNS